MKRVCASDKVYVKQSKIPGAGRGVFARRNIKKGEVVEECPIIEIPAYNVASLGESVLVTYFFFYGFKKEKLLIALGFGSIYNHSYKPNAAYEIKDVEKMMVFTALTSIKKDNEVMFDYNRGNTKNKRPLWFETE